MALRRDAVGDVIGRTANLPTQQSPGFSVCGWAYRTTDRNAYSALAMLESVSGYSYIGMGADGDDLVVEWTSGAATVQADVPNATWFFWAMSNLANTNIIGYYGARGATSLTSAQSATGAMVFTPTSFLIGNSLASDWFNGRFAYVRVWDAVLTAAEFFAEMNGPCKRRANLRYEWPLLGATDTRDLSINAWGPTLTSVATEDNAPVDYWPVIPEYSSVFAAAAPGGGVDEDFLPRARIVKVPRTRYTKRPGDTHLYFPATPAPGALPPLVPALTRRTEYRHQRLIHNDQHPQTPVIEVGYVPLLPQRNIRHSGRH